MSAPPSSRRQRVPFRFAVIASLVRHHRFPLPEAEDLVRAWERYVRYAYNSEKTPEDTADHLVRFEQSQVPPWERDLDHYGPATIGRRRQVSDELVDRAITEDLERNFTSNVGTDLGRRAREVAAADPELARGLHREAAYLHPYDNAQHERDPQQVGTVALLRELYARPVTYGDVRRHGLQDAAETLTRLGLMQQQPGRGFGRFILTRKGESAAARVMGRQARTASTAGRRPSQAPSRRTSPPARRTPPKRSAAVRAPQQQGRRVPQPVGTPSRRVCSRGTELVTLIFPPEFGPDGAREWAEGHGFIFDERTVEFPRTTGSIRVPQRAAENFEKGTFGTKMLSPKDNIRALFACPRAGRESDITKGGPGRPRRPRESRQTREAAPTRSRSSGSARPSSRTQADGRTTSRAVTPRPVREGLQAPPSPDDKLVSRFVVPGSGGRYHVAGLYPISGEASRFRIIDTTRPTASPVADFAAENIDEAIVRARQMLTTIDRDW